MTQMNVRWTSWLRFLDLRQRLFKAIKETIEDPDATWKSYEGALYIEYCLPNYFEELDEKPAKWIIHLSCYLIGPTRGSDWEGETFEDALDQAEADINEWLEDHEEWMATKGADKYIE
jgi:hypothetical protein